MLAVHNTRHVESALQIIIGRNLLMTNSVPLLTDQLAMSTSKCPESGECIHAVAMVIGYSY